MGRFEGLVLRMVELTEVLRSGRYEGHHGTVRTLIADCRRFLAEEHSELGPWEAAELDYAEAAVGWDFLNLAVVSAHKALQVSRLPRAEYEYGFNYGKWRAGEAAPV